MANILIPSDITFREEMKKVDVADPVHANIVNPLFETLLLNTVYLYRENQKLSDRLAKMQEDNTFGGSALSPEANREDLMAQYPTLVKTSSTALDISLFTVTVDKLRLGLYSLLIRMKVSANTATERLIKITAKSGGNVLEERTVSASMLEAANLFQVLGFNVNFNTTKDSPLTIQAVLLKNSANVTVTVDYVMLQATHTAITSL